MRNLKRALSLTLASVMLLGMMVVGSSAAAGYDDVSETDNVEAIEVLQAIEVMVGDERGFGPERPVNRAEMAVVMGKLLSLDYNYYTATCPFNDVYDWARGWVGACAANGIVSGRGEGVYDPGATVTAVEAASMLMRALGYFKYQNDYADGFEVSTVRQGTKIGIFDQVGSSATEPMTRNQVAQMVLNALQSAVVEPDGNTINLTTPDGTVYTGKVNYVSVTSAKPFATAISRTQATSVGSQNDGWIVELGERLYDGKLKLTDTTDAFGRPSRYWEYDAKEIGTYVKEELIRETYTVKVTGRTLHDLLGSTILKDYDLDVYIDGEDDPSINNKLFDARHLVRTNDVGVGGTGKGVLTQVFVDPDEGDNGLITISVINTYLAIADEDFDDRTDSLDVTVYGINEFVKDHYIKNADNTDGHSNANKTGDSQKEGFILETEDFPSIVDAKDGDAYLVNVAQGEVQTIAKPEIMTESQITSFKVGDWIVSGGTQYDFASAAEFECETLYAWTQDNNSVVNLKEISYNIYLDKYGYAVGVEEVERVNNYVFITGVDTNTNNRFATQADASGIFMDGTMESMKIDLQAARELNDGSRTYNALTNVNSIKGSSLINKWFTYTVGDDGIYTVSLVRDSDAIDNDRARAAQFRTLTKDDAPSVIDTYQVPAGEVSGLGDTHGVNTVEGPKSIALRGNASANNKWYSVYGDDESVYIVAELKTINHSKSNEVVNVIGGVDSVTVGIDNTNIEVWDRAKAMGADLGAVDDTAYGTYTLFDKDGDVIAAVVVGEDAGTVTNLVYTHKGMNSETDNNAAGSETRASGVKGTYTWTRYVIAEGEETLLTEVGSGLSKLRQMQPNTWYVVKYKASGEVKNVYPAWATENYNFKGLIDSDAKNEPDNAKRLEDRYVNDIEELNRATNENGLVLYEVGQYNRTSNTDLRVGNIPMLTTKPSVDNHTFYVTTDTNAGVHRGFRVADDVKTVFIQTVNNDEQKTYETTYSGLEKVVGRLHDKAETNRSRWANPDTYHYEVSAVMKNGKASVVVIRDLNNAGAVIDGVNRNYNLKLYGNLFTSPTTVTGASNAVVVVNDKEIAPTGIGVDKWGNYTTYSIPQGARVGITDYDIDNTDPAFTYLTNILRYSETGVSNPYNLLVRYLNRSITFTMPAYETWIDGGRMNKDGTSPFRETITGEKADKEPSLEKVDITFAGKSEGTPIGLMSYGDPIQIVISNKAAKSRAAEIPALKAGDKYIVTLGNPQVKINATVNASNEITFTYYLSGADIRAGEVVVYSIVADSTNTPASEYQVTIPAGVTVTDKDGKAIASGKVAKGTVIVVKASTDKTKVVKVNGVAIDKDTEFTVTGPITITLEEVKEDEVALTVNVDATKGTATLAKTTVKKGESTTLTVEPKKADSTVAVTTTSGLTATKGANDRTWTIAVASTGTIATPATVTVTITEKGEEPPVTPTDDPAYKAKYSAPNYELYAHKSALTNGALDEAKVKSALLAAIQAQEKLSDAAIEGATVTISGTNVTVAKDGQTIATGKILANGNGSAASPKPLYAISYKGSVLAYVENSTNTVKGIPTGTIVMSDAAAVAASSAGWLSASNQVTNVTVSTADVNLVDARAITAIPANTTVFVENLAGTMPAQIGFTASYKYVQASQTMYVVENTGNETKSGVSTSLVATPSVSTDAKTVQTLPGTGNALTFSFKASELPVDNTAMALSCSTQFDVTVNGNPATVEDVGGVKTIKGLEKGTWYMAVDYSAVTPVKYSVVNSGAYANAVQANASTGNLTMTTLLDAKYVGPNGKIDLIPMRVLTFTGGGDNFTKYVLDGTTEMTGITKTTAESVIVPVTSSVEVTAKLNSVYIIGTSGSPAVSTYLSKGTGFGVLTGTIAAGSETVTVSVAATVNAIELTVKNLDADDTKTVGGISIEASLDGATAAAITEGGSVKIRWNVGGSSKIVADTDYTVTITGVSADAGKVIKDGLVPTVTLDAGTCSSDAICKGVKVTPHADGTYDIEMTVAIPTP